MPIVLFNLVDRALDLTIAPGYSRLGYQLRRRGWPGGGADLPRMDGRVVLVTGATAGIGRAAAERFAALGARVILLARDGGRADRARREITATTGNEDVAIVLADLSCVLSVRDAVRQITEQEAALHVLVNNAGVMSAERRLSADGVELTLATNVVGPYVLTEGLTDLLVRSGPARIITVSSGGMYAQGLELQDPQTAHREYDGTSAYARAKRMQVVLSGVWAQRLRDRGVVAHAMHPGWADTPGVQTSLPRFRQVMRPLLRTPAEGADTIVWLAAASEPGRRTGDFWHDRRRRPVHLLPSTREQPGDAERLVGVIEAIVAGTRVT